MQDDLLNSQDKLDAAAGSFADLLGHPGWLLLKNIIELNISVLTDRIIQGGESEEDMNRLRDKLQIHKDILATPANTIKQAKAVETEEPSFDPYEKPKLYRIDKPTA